MQAQLYCHRQDRISLLLRVEIKLSLHVDSKTNGSNSGRVDIYNTSTGTWTTHQVMALELSAAAAAGVKIAIGGGFSNTAQYSDQGGNI